MADPIIIPGPWSILGGLGGAFKNIHDIKQDKRQRKIEDEERNRLHSQQDLQTLLQLMPYMQQGQQPQGQPTGVGVPTGAQSIFPSMDPFAQPKGGDQGLPQAVGQVPNSGYPVPPQVQKSLGALLGNPNIQLGPSPAMRMDQFNLQRAPIEAKQRDTAFETNQRGEALKQESATLTLAEMKQKWDTMKNLSQDQLQAMWNIPNSIDLTTQNDKQLQEIARRFVYTASGDANAAYAAAELQPKTQPFVKQGKLTRDFFGAAAREFEMDMRKLDIEAMRAANTGGRYRTPQEYLDDLYRNTTAERNSKVTEMQNYTIAGKILTPAEQTRAGALRGEVEKLDRQIDLIRGAFVTKMGVPTAPGQPTVTQNPASPGAKVSTPAVVDPQVINSIVERISVKKATMKDVDDLVAKGLLTPADKKAIEDRLNKGATK